MKKIVSLLLALAMLFSLAACGDNSGDQPSQSQSNSPAPSQSGEQPTQSGEQPTESDTGSEPGEFVPMTYEEQVVFDTALGDFYNAFMEAKGATTTSERYALMAVAEAKLLESGVLIPTQGDGGRYGIRHSVPRTIPSVGWGSDPDRLASMIVVNELLKAADSSEVTKLWNELAGTGTFEDEVKKLLTEKGYTFNDSIDYIYTSDPKTWDYLATWQSTQSQPTCFLVDGLVIYDMENVMQPGLAESWDMSEDGLTYTFKIRQGVKWVDSQGREVGEVQADDWVAGLQHCADCGGGAAEMLSSLVGMSDYLDGTTSDFSNVGVTAVDKYTLEYKFTAPLPYFLSALTYVGLGGPLCRSYYESQGGKFGAEFDSSAADYVYGQTPNNIAYCGPMLVTSWTQNNSIVYKANDSYWDPDLLNIHEMTWKYWDGQDVLQPYYDVKDGKLASIALSAERLEQCKKDGLFEEYAILSVNSSKSTYNGYYNLNRVRYANYDDETKGVSPKTADSAKEINLAEGVYTSDIQDEAARWHNAINNQNFRLALTFGFDRGEYLAQQYGEDLKYNSMRNTFVPGNFVSLEEEVTVDGLGSFPAGTYYGAMVQAQLDADGFPAKVWDPEADDGLGSSDGYDGWYNPEAAKGYLAKAVEELAAEGIEVTKENPIQMDVMYHSGDQTYVNQYNAYKKGLEDVLGGLVQVNLVGFADRNDYYSSSYFPTAGADYNYDVSFASGWSADYADPGNFLETLVPPPDGTGYVTMSFGLW